jgi:hypothetical protein
MGSTVTGKLTHGKLGSRIHSRRLVTPRSDSVDRLHEKPQDPHRPWNPHHLGHSVQRRSRRSSPRDLLRHRPLFGQCRTQPALPLGRTLWERVSSIPLGPEGWGSRLMSLNSVELVSGNDLASRLFPGNQTLRLAVKQSPRSRPSSTTWSSSRRLITPS